MTTREILDQINAGVAAVTEKVSELESRTDLGTDEGKAAIRAMVDDILDAQKEARRNYQPDRAPVESVVDKALGIAGDQAGGLFAKKYRMPYERLVKDIQTTHPVISRGSDREQLRELGESHDAVMCIKAYVDNKFGKKESEAQRAKRFYEHPDVLRHAHLLKLAGYHEKANEIMNPSASGQSSLDFTYLSTNLIERVVTEYEVANLFFSFTMTRASQEINIPTNEAMCLLGGPPPLTTYPTGGITPTPGIAFMQQLNFVKRAFSAKHALVFLPFNDDMVEDSIIPWMPYVMNQAVLGLARGADQACLEGDDDGGGHQDHHAALPVVAPDYRVAFAGLKKMSIDNFSVDGAGNITTAKLDTTRELMGRFGRRVSQLRIITGYTQWYAMIKLAEFQNLNEVGSLAQAVNGEFGSFRGIPVVLTDLIRSDLSATGLYDNATKTKTVMHIVRPDRFWLGTFNGVETESTRIAPQLMTLVQTDVRRDFKAADAHLMGTEPVFDDIEAPCTTIYNLPG